MSQSVIVIVIVVVIVIDIGAMLAQANHEMFLLQTVNKTASDFTRARNQKEHMQCTRPI